MRQITGVKKLQLFYAKAKAFALHAGILVFVVHGLFEVKRGECLGIIGRKGAGKSTLLKMLNGIFMPDKGKITIKGKVDSRFHPMLNGREMVYVEVLFIDTNKKVIN